MPFITVSSLLGSTQLELYGFILAGLFFVVVAITVPTQAYVHSFLVFWASLFSPAVLLGIERGNSDLLILVLVVVAALLASGQRPFQHLGAFVILFLAVVLKIYPCFAACILIRGTLRRGLVLAGAFSTCCLFYAMFTWHDLHLIRKATPRGGNLSYGRDVLWMAMLPFKPSLSSWLQLASRFWSVFVFPIAGVMAFWRPAFVRYQGNSVNERVSINLFRGSSSIYVGTFLLGNNYDYRLMFLVLAIPQLLDWSRGSCLWLRRVSGTLIAGILFCQWEMVFFKAIHLLSMSGEVFTLVAMISEAASWVVFTVMVVVLIGIPFIGKDQHLRPLVITVV